MLYKAMGAINVFQKLFIRINEFILAGRGGLDWL